jgi:hypothetical protein
MEVRRAEDFEARIVGGRRLDCQRFPLSPGTVFAPVDCPADGLLLPVAHFAGRQAILLSPSAPGGLFHALLASLHAATLVKLRFFAGLTNQEAAGIVGRRAVNCRRRLGLREELAAAGHVAWDRGPLSQRQIAAKFSAPHRGIRPFFSH